MDGGTVIEKKSYQVSHFDENPLNWKWKDSKPLSESVFVCFFALHITLKLMLSNNIC